MKKNLFVSCYRRIVEFFSLENVLKKLSLSFLVLFSSSSIFLYLWYCQDTRYYENTIVIKFLLSIIAGLVGLWIIVLFFHRFPTPVGSFIIEFKDGKYRNEKILLRDEILWDHKDSKTQKLFEKQDVFSGWEIIHTTNDNNKVLCVEWSFLFDSRVVYLLDEYTRLDGVVDFDVEKAMSRVLREVASSFKEGDLEIHPKLEDICVFDKILYKGDNEVELTEEFLQEVNIILGGLVVELKPTLKVL